VHEIADLQAVSLSAMDLLMSDPPAIYARICGDVIRVGNFWREVPEIAEAGSKIADLLGATQALRIGERSCKSVAI
jgi:hypothetical protein